MSAAAIAELLNSGLGVVGMLVLVLCACAVTYTITRRSVMNELEAVRSHIGEIAGLRNAVQELATLKLATRDTSKPVQAVEMPKSAAKSEPVKPVVEPPEKSDEISHETLVVIAAAVAAFLGKSVRLRSARLIPPVGESPWAQQGRVYVQASHNLARA